MARAGLCRNWAGRDRTWQWYNGEEGASAEGESINGILMNRTLEEGRFADLIVSGAPLEDDATGSASFLVPTRAGVLKLGANGPEGQFSAPEDGWLSRGSDGHALLITRTGPVPLLGSDRPACPALVDLASRLPQDATVLREVPVGDYFSQVTILTGSSRVQLLVPCDAVSDTLAWSLPVDVSGRRRLNAVRSGIASEFLSMSVSDAGFSVGDGRHEVRAVTDTFPDVVAQLALPDGRAGFVVTKDALYRIDVDRALSLLAGSKTMATHPEGPFAPPVEAESPPPPPTAKPPATGQDVPRSETARPARSPTREGGKVRALPAPPDDITPLTLNPEQAREVQTVLRAQQLYRGRIDGIIGRLSRAAIREWQKRNNVPVTGRLTEFQFDLMMEQGG